MKNQVQTRGMFSLVLTLFLSAILFGSCQKEIAQIEKRAVFRESIPSKVVVGSSTSGISTQIIYAGQTIKSGSVTYDDIDTNGDKIDDALQVSLQSIDGWEFVDISFFVGSTLSELPTNKSGNPIPGQFPHKSGSILGKTSHTFTIPFNTLGFSCPNTGTGNYYVAVHAGLRKPLGGGTYQTESGWGDGSRLVARGNWAMFNQIFITCDVNDDPPPAATTETAFAFDGDATGCFQNYSQFLDNPQRWGWTNGPYPQGTYTLKIYAGAGQCDINKGVYVGDLSVNYSGTSATVKFTLFGTNPVTTVPYTLREVHLFVGNDEFPKITNGAQAGEFTIAPGKFPFKATGLSGQTYTFTVNNLSGNVYVIAHAVVHGFPE